MAWLLIAVYLDSFVANFGEKISTKLAYLPRTLVKALFTFK